MNPTPHQRQLSAKRQERFKKARKKAGWERIEFWIRNDLVARAKELIANLHKGEK